MKITNESGVALGGPWAQLGGDPTQGEGETPIDCCNPGGDPPPDRALEQNVVTVNTPETGGIVQITDGVSVSGGAAFSEDYAATPDNGDTLYALLFCEDGTGINTIDSAGWSLIETATASGSEVTLWSKVAGAAEPTTVHVPSNGAGGTRRRLVLYDVAGSHDVSDSLSAQGVSSPFTGPTLTPGSTEGVLIAAFIARVPTYVGDPTLTPEGTLSTDTFARTAGTRLVQWTGNAPTDTNPYTPMVDATGAFEGETASLDVNVDASPTAVLWNVPAPLTVDDDDATYQEIEGSNVLRIDLGGPFRIVRSVVLAGSEDPGPRTYMIRGANAADFSDAVNLDSEAFTATGSFTPDTVELLWNTAETYRYFELTGSLETRRVFTWSLYEPDTSQGQDHSHDTIEDDISDLQTQVSLLGGRWELAVITGSPPDPLYADGDFLYILVT